MIFSCQLWRMMYEGPMLPSNRVLLITVKFLFQDPLGQYVLVQSDVY